MRSSKIEAPTDAKSKDFKEYLKGQLQEVQNSHMRERFAYYNMAGGESHQERLAHMRT